MDANETLEATLARADRLFASGTGTTLGILTEADQILSQRLHGLVKKGGGPKVRFSEAHALLWRRQIQITQDYLNERLQGHTHAQATKAVAASVASTVKLAKKLEKQFTGILRPLALDDQAMQDHITRGTGASLLRKHQASVRRYGTMMITDFERVLRSSLLAGLNQHQTISRIVSTGKLGGVSAGRLHDAEPAYFPEPTSYLRRRYWAERIVRTESAHAYNAGGLATIQTAKVTDFPDMQKKIVATFDWRTAPDSIAVHGQIKPVADMFVDGAGRHYLHPPARPNDREVVIPWRPHWQELPASQPATPAEQAAAVQEIQAKGEKTESVKKLVQQKAAELAAQKATQASAAGGMAAAQASALAAQAEGQRLAGQARAADLAQLAVVSQKVKQAKLAPTLEELKAKAAAYQAEKAAKIEAAKLEAERRRVQALRKAVAQHVATLQGMTWQSGPHLVNALKSLGKNNPAVFAELHKQAVGKLPGKKPSYVAIAKNLAPSLTWPSKKVPKKTALESFQELQKASGDKPAEFLAAVSKLPAGDAAEVVKEKGLEIKPSGGAYLDVWNNGVKVAYFTQADGAFTVSPPATLPGGWAQHKFTDQNAAALYAQQVGLAFKVFNSLPKPAAPAKPAPKPWSDAWKAPKRPLVKFSNLARQVDDGLAEDTRHGKAVAVDGDAIEGFSVHFTTQIVGGERQTVARFKVTDLRGPDVLKRLARLGDERTFDGFHSLRSIDSPALQMERDAKFAATYLGAVKMHEAQIGPARVRGWKSTQSGLSGLPAMHHLVELRFPEPAGDGERWKVFQRVAKELGIATTAPGEDERRAYARAKILALATRASSRAIAELKSRSPGDVNEIWQAHRNEVLDAIEADAALREVAPGHFALYSARLAEEAKAAKVDRLSHDLSGGTRIVPNLVGRDFGLLSSRERFERGIFTKGASTQEDFTTGGADSVFVRMQSGASGRNYDRLEIDPSELGRFDWYAFDSDHYGRAGDGSRSSRVTLQSLREANGSFGYGNEVMLQRVLGSGSVRRVLVTPSDRAALIGKLQEAGISEVNGIPIADFVVAPEG